MKYFTISEMLKSDTALKMRIWNGATKEHEDNMRALIENVLDPLRERYGHPIYVSSGYRCPKLNKAVNGAINSQHMRGEAADIYAKGIGDGGSQSAMTTPSGSASQGVGPSTLRPGSGTSGSGTLTTTTAPQSVIAGKDPQSPAPMNYVSENLKLARLIAEAGNFDQMILEEVGPNDLNPKWIHVSYKRNGWNRKSIIKKVVGKAGYVTVKAEELF